MRRLLTEEGLGWRIEELEDGHGLVLFADGTRHSAMPFDPISEQDGGIRFHGARTSE